MVRPWRIRYSGAKYHVSARGNGRQQIYFGDEDYERFLEQLEVALEKDQVILYAYCLMPNHYHLFVETPLGNVHRFEQRLNTAYGMYFRYKHKKPGHCFQGRYGGKLVGGDDYIVRLTRYIHLNPVNTKAMKRRSLEECKGYLNRYRWSSFPGYVRQKQAGEWVDYRWLGLMHGLTETGNRRAYRRYVQSMIGKKDDVLDAALSASRYAIGDEAFIQQAEEELRELHVRKGLFGEIHPPSDAAVAVETVEEAVAKHFGVSVEALHEHGRRTGEAKAVAVELCCMLTGRSQRELARHFGYKTDAGVSRQRRVVRERAAEDPKLRRAIQRLAKNLGAIV